jgi:pantoate--beta-alanine ligase
MSCTARADLVGAGITEIDYLELRSDPDLVPLASADRPGRLFVAAWLDGVRLIDNQPVKSAVRSSDPAVTHHVSG